MPDYGSVKERFYARYPLTSICRGILAFLSDKRTYLWLMPEVEVVAASAMTHVYECEGCRYRLSGGRRLN